MPSDPELPPLEMEDLEIVYVSSLQDVIHHLSGKNLLPIVPTEYKEKEDPSIPVNFNQIIGHSYAKRASGNCSSR